MWFSSLSDGHETAVVVPLGPARVSANMNTLLGPLSVVLVAGMLLMAGIVENAKDITAIAADYQSTIFNNTHGTIHGTAEHSLCTSDLIKLVNWTGWNASDLQVTSPSPYASNYYCSPLSLSGGDSSGMCGLNAASLFLLLRSLSPPEYLNPYVYIPENDTRLWKTPVTTTMAGVPYLLADRVAWRRAGCRILRCSLHYMVT